MRVLNNDGCATGGRHCMVGTCSRACSYGHPRRKRRGRAAAQVIQSARRGAWPTHTRDRRLLQSDLSTQPQRPGKPTRLARVCSYKRPMLVVWTTHFARLTDVRLCGRFA